eukprot:CAMPEP_0172757870 /NCGR_PEP_ID=MMETSP1074-20121228/164625_1 /TAXON_ID=2916 /ORGANISM="Ceratium fusus, Strain PA161109" /LENGTH=129 /DNA_ID=CAMNT_0013591357 /DNA_START=397 /DNA_END=783 /DNA_ORIENTATION=+
MTRQDVLCWMPSPSAAKLKIHQVLLNHHHLHAQPQGSAVQLLLAILQLVLDVLAAVVVGTQAVPTVAEIVSLREPRLRNNVSAISAALLDDSLKELNGLLQLQRSTSHRRTSNLQRSPGTIRVLEPAAA